MPELKFNGKKVRKGKEKSYPDRQEPTTKHYALVGASPPVMVQETVWPSGKRNFYVQARFQGAPRVRSSAKSRRPRRIYRLYSRNSYSGQALTLPAALAKLEKRMQSAFKQLAKALGYTVEG